MSMAAIRDVIKRLYERPVRENVNAIDGSLYVDGIYKMMITDILIMECQTSRWIVQL